MSVVALDIAFNDLIVPGRMKKVNLASIKVGFQRLGLLYVSPAGVEEDIDSTSVYDYFQVY